MTHLHPILLSTLLLLLLLPLPSPADEPRQQIHTFPDAIAAKTDNLHEKFWLYRPKPTHTTNATEAADDKLPLIIYLHGSSRRGRDIHQVKANGLPPLLDRLGNDDDFNFIVASPQALWKYPWQQCWRPDDLILLLDHLLATEPIDPARVYVTGLSMGGYGTWATIAKHPDRFAAAIPICGGGDPASAKAIGPIPVWAFHGEDDFIVPIKRSEEMVAAIQTTGGNATLTRYPKVGHDSFTRTYANPKIYEWLLTHPRAK